MQFSFWQVYYCSSAISFFDGFRSLPLFFCNFEKENGSRVTLAFVS